jgi:hypothetical protein
MIMKHLIASLIFLLLAGAASAQQGWNYTPPSGGGGGSGLTVNSTTITGGAANKALIDNGGTLEELSYGVTGANTLVETSGAGFISGAILNIAIGSGEVTGGTSNGLLYNNAGVPGNLGVVNNAVVVTNGSGAPSESTTLPSGLTLPGYGALGTANVWSAQQSATVTTLSISTATFTPTGASNDYAITLVHASCPCTLANPSATPVAGTHGVIFVTQSSTGSDLISTWGSQYEAPGGTSTITLSTGAGAVDVLAYVVKDATHILLVPSLNFSH